MRLPALAGDASTDDTPANETNVELLLKSFNGRFVLIQEETVLKTTYQAPTSPLDIFNMFFDSNSDALVQGEQNKALVKYIRTTIIESEHYLGWGNYYRFETTDRSTDELSNVHFDMAREQIQFSFRGTNIQLRMKLEGGDEQFKLEAAWNTSPGARIDFPKRHTIQLLMILYMFAELYARLNNFEGSPDGRRLNEVIQFEAIEDLSSNQNIIRQVKMTTVDKIHLLDRNMFLRELDSWFMLKPREDLNISGGGYSKRAYKELLKEYFKGGLHTPGYPIPLSDKVLVKLQLRDAARNVKDVEYISMLLTNVEYAQIKKMHGSGEVASRFFTLYLHAQKNDGTDGDVLAAFDVDYRQGVDAVFTRTKTNLYRYYITESSDILKALLITAMQVVLLVNEPGGQSIPDPKIQVMQQEAAKLREQEAKLREQEEAAALKKKEAEALYTPTLPDMPLPDIPQAPVAPVVPDYNLLDPDYSMVPDYGLLDRDYSKQKDNSKKKDDSKQKDDSEQKDDLVARFLATRGTVYDAPDDEDDDSWKTVRGFERTAYTIPGGQFVKGSKVYNPAYNVGHAVIYEMHTEGTDPPNTAAVVTDIWQWLDKKNFNAGMMDYLQVSPSAVFHGAFHITAASSKMAQALRLDCTVLDGTQYEVTSYTVIGDPKGYFGVALNTDDDEDVVAGLQIALDKKGLRVYGLYHGDWTEFDDSDDLTTVINILVYFFITQYFPDEIAAYREAHKKSA